jgi:branched-chain amino acid transport system ATP-binding protein
LASSLTIEGVDAAYGAVRVLEDVTLSVKPAETVVLLGTNGNGKSTLIKCIMGIVRPRTGRIMAAIDGIQHDLTTLTTEQIVDLGIALVPEGRRLFPKLTVEENLALGAYRPTARAQMKQNLQACFETFPRLAERRSQLAGSMSGGEQQMLALARAVASRPGVLLLDELSMGLAPLVVSSLYQEVASIAASGVAILVVEQFARVALQVADHATVLAGGRVMASGTPAELEGSLTELYLGSGT